MKSSSRTMVLFMVIGAVIGALIGRASGNALLWGAVGLACGVAIAEGKIRASSSE